MSLLNNIKDTIVHFRRGIWDLFLKFVSVFINPLPDQIAFIPHGGIYGNSYDLCNYKSDNSLVLLIYMLRRYGNHFSYRLACDSRQFSDIEKYIKDNYPNIDLSCVHFFGPNSFHWKTYKELMKSKYIFTCEGYNLPFKRRCHKVVFLSYFKPFKDDYKHQQSMKINSFENLFDLCISPSSIYSNIVAHTYGVSFSKFVSLGFSRDDMLLSEYNCPQLEKVINTSVDYEVKKVLLYTPTHRDYERQSTEKRDLLGFSVDQERFESYLRSNGILIICKLHTQQNSSVVDCSLKGVVLHDSTEDYGLCELLQRADCLMTDYTSTYFDYLLLDRPVIFNFYDYERYYQTRGFSFDPLDPILAGDIVNDELSFYDKMNKIIEGRDDYKQHRKYVRDLMHKYIDTDSSKRICDYVFNN